MIVAYNKEHIGDVLLIAVADDQGQENNVERKGDVACVRIKESGKIVAWNLFNASTHLDEIKGQGQVFLTDKQMDQLNILLEQAGFSEQLEKDHEPKIVVGYVKSCKKHLDSDHLSITQTQVDNDELLQIVCGASNIKAGQKVVVAKPGAMMPDGLMIWPGVLRGEESFGMICSAKELNVPQGSEKKGILELPFDAVVGTAFQVGK